MKALLSAAALLACAGCATLPSLEGRTDSHALALTDTAGTRLARATDAPAARHPGLTGIYAVPLAGDAFAARVLLAAAAERSLDAQYYIWHADETGLMLLQALRDAARRGVRVRLLIDDQNTKGLDGMFAALDATPNMEVRLYNPFATRSARFLDYLGDFSRLNRRMHNKAFIADNRVAIVGGRNIGNEYFGAGDEIPFKDLDVLAVGAAVPQLSEAFDLYWNSASAYPVTRLAGPDAARGEDLDVRFAAARAAPDAVSYVAAVRGTPLIRDLVDRHLALEWTEAMVVRDDPAKTLEETPTRSMLALAQVLDVTGKPRHSFDLISPYFVPGEKGTATIVALAASGVRVRVLTNSLGGTDVAVVHSGYAKRRCELARAGVQLYELKPAVTPLAEPRRRSSTDSSAAASLHAKTFAVDGEAIFVGSFNFDPRSALLNTELGVVLKSRKLAQRLSASFDEAIPANAYAVRARKDGACIEWIERTPRGETVLEDEPNSSWLGRAWLEFLMVLPIDWML